MLPYISIDPYKTSNLNIFRTRWSNKMNVVEVLTLYVNFKFSRLHYLWFQEKVTKTIVEVLHNFDPHWKYTPLRSLGFTLCHCRLTCHCTTSYYWRKTKLPMNSDNHWAILLGISFIDSLEHENLGDICHLYSQII